MPSNGASANVVHLDLDLNFQGHDFLNMNIEKTVRASETCSSNTFAVDDIRHRMAPL